MSGERNVGVGQDATNSPIVTGNNNQILFGAAAPAPPGTVAKPVSLPYPSLGPLFKGREPFLDELRASLQAAHPGHATAIVGKALHGLGGVGKTRLAVEYAHRHGADYPAALLFVSAETPADLHRNLAAFSGPVVPGPSQTELPEEAARLASVCAWLRAHPGWLLILDNADTEAVAEAVETLLATLHGGDVLITSRFTQWGPGIETRELDVLSLEAATDFLLERTAGKRRAQPSDTTDAAKLAARLEGLALALEQAGAYIAYRRVTFAEYLRDWEAQLPAVLGWHNERLMKYSRSVAVTWETTLQHLGAAEVALLRLLAFFAPEPIPQFLLEEDGASSMLHEAAELLHEEDRARVPIAIPPLEALATLANFSLLRWESSAAAPTLSVHRVVQEILRSHVPAERVTAWLYCTLHLLTAAKLGDPSDVRNWGRWDPLRPHFLQVTASADQAGLSGEITPSIHRLALFLYSKALYSEAEPLMRRALALDEACFGPDHPNVANQLTNLACLLQDTNRLREAEPLMRRALAINEACFGPEHPNVAICLNNLANLLQATNRLEEAEPLMRRALAINEACFSSNHPNVARNLNNLAQLLHDTNRPEEAEPLMRRALALDEACFGPDHPNVANRLTNLACLLQATNRVGEAEPLMRRALAINEASFGRDHPNVARNLNNLAQLLKDTNRPEEAEPLMRRALALDEASFGPDHPNVALRLNNLATLLLATNRLGEAEPLMLRALALDEASFSSNHPNVARNLNNLAQLLHDTNRPGEAEPLMRRALALDEASFGPEHPNVAICLNNLANLLQATNRVGEAEPLMRRALTINEASFGPDHPNVASHLNNLALLLKDTKRLGEAEPLMRRAVEILLQFQQQTGHEHPNFRVVAANHDVLLKNLRHQTPVLARMKATINATCATLGIRKGD
jgi:tetratricopeptide (TPR) repeat protein